MDSAYNYMRQSNTELVSKKQEPMALIPRQWVKKAPGYDFSNLAPLKNFLSPPSSTDQWFLEFSQVLMANMTKTSEELYDVYGIPMVSTALQNRVNELYAKNSVEMKVSANMPYMRLAVSCVYTYDSLAFIRNALKNDQKLNQQLSLAQSVSTKTTSEIALENVRNMLAPPKIPIFPTISTSKYWSEMLDNGSEFKKLVAAIAKFTAKKKEKPTSESPNEFRRRKLEETLNRIKEAQPFWVRMQMEGKNEKDLETEAYRA